MICICISEPDINKCLETIANVEMAEIRLDLTGFNIEEIIKVFSSHKKLIATSRPSDNLEENKKKLIAAIEAGAAYVDIEYEAPEEYRNEIISVAKSKECDVIVSYHNYNETPSLDELQNIVSECYSMGADVAKIAVMANKEQDCARVLSLYDTSRRIVAIGMGEKGKITRVAAPLLGAEFTFAAPDGSAETGPGQLSNAEMKELLGKMKI